MLKYKYIFQIKYAEAILSNNTRKLLWFEISKTLIAVLKNCCVNYMNYNFRQNVVPYGHVNAVCSLKTRIKGPSTLPAFTDPEQGS